MGAVRRSPGLVVASILCLSAGLLTPAGAQGNGAPAGKVTAQSAALLTTYTAALADPENNPMYYKWGASVPCGKFIPGDVETSTWDRGGGTPCAPGADAEGVVWVHVTDIISYVGCYYKGSATGEGGACVTAQEVPRRVRLIMRSKGNKLAISGSVRLESTENPAALTACLTDQPIDIQKKKKRRWVTKKSVNTNEAGEYSVQIGDKPGTYRALSAQLSVADPSAENVAFYNCVVGSSPPVPNR